MLLRCTQVLDNFQSKSHYQVNENFDSGVVLEGYILSLSLSLTSSRAIEVRSKKVEKYYTELQI